MSIPKIDPYPPAPTPEDSEEVFDDKAYAHAASLELRRVQMNEVATYVNTRASDANNRATASASSATASANSATRSDEWANKAPGSVVASGKYSARHYSDLSDRFANAPEDVEVEPGKYSALHWQEKAKKIADVHATTVAADPLPTVLATNVQAALQELAYQADQLRVAKNQMKYGDGPYPTMDFQFQGSKMLDPRIDFTRASADWDWDGHEYEIDEPVLTDEGLWVSGARTNLIENSENLLTNTANNLTVTSTDSSWFRVDYDEESGSSRKELRLVSTVLYQDGDILTGSVDLRKGSVTIVDIRLGRFSITDSATIDLETGDVIRQGSSVLHFTTKKNGDGSVRVYISTARTSSPSSWYFQVGYEAVGGSTAQSTGHFFVKSPMLMEGMEVTPYIPTEGSQVTVASTRAVSQGLPITNSGAFVFSAVCCLYQRFNILIGSGSGNTEEIRFQLQGRNWGAFILRAEDVERIISTPRDFLTEGEVFKGAFTFEVQANGYVRLNCFINGTFIGEGQLPRLPTGFLSSGVAIGSRRANSNALHWGENILSVTYFNKRLSDEQLQELTTL